MPFNLSYLLVLAACIAPLSACQLSPAPPPVAASYDVVPRPQRIAPADGAFSIGRNTRIYLVGPEVAEARATADFLVDYIRAASGVRMAVEIGEAPAGGRDAISLQLRPDAGIPAEGYRLSVTPEAVTLIAGDPAGLFYGVQTVRQLLPLGLRAGATIPAVEIEDAPRFRYRGMHLDVSRHFFAADFVKKYIDLMAMYKMNNFHWHLTEDQGWRIEIQRYPRLTGIGSCRAETRVGHPRRSPTVEYDGTPHCGFYTQAEIREIVEYAAVRHVNVIPEIELPGHARAALAAYPELGCRPGPFEVATTWGIFEDIFCPSEETFTFLQGVFEEVMDLFPGEYVHIGGDEAPKKQWEESALARAVMQREGLADEHELQSYFIRRVEGVLNARGRKLIGWDEIIEGGLSPTATVMFWRDHSGAGVGVQGGVDPARVAVSSGNDLIMTPNQRLYFDHYQGDPETEPLAIGGRTLLHEVYDYEPIPPHFTPEEARYVLGAQANVWTEYMRTPEHVEYMVFPRLLALSEVVWSPREARDWGFFTARLPRQLGRLRALGVNYRDPGS